MNTLKIIAFTLVLVGAHAFAQPLTTTTKSIQRKIGQCKLDLKYTLVTGTSPAANKINFQVQTITNNRIQDYNSIMSSCQETLTQEYSINSATTVSFNGTDWSSWVENEWSYTGGAHGGGGDHLMVFDSQGNRVKFTDVLSAPSSSMINSIRAKVQATRGDQFEQQSFNMWAQNPDALANLNFSADEDGITILFNSYEIASYAAGPTEIKFSWMELKPLLNRNSVFRSALN